jgi:WD40 repeat protein
MVCLRVLEGHTRQIFNVSVTPDGLHAVSASYDQTLWVWDLEMASGWLSLALRRQ